MSAFTVQYLEQSWSIEYEDQPAVSTALVAEIVAQVSDEQLAASIEEYFTEHPVAGGESLWEAATVGGDEGIAPIGGAAVLVEGAVQFAGLTAPDGQTRPLVVDDTGAVAVGAVNSPGGLARLDGSATLPDSLGPAAWARDSEVPHDASELPFDNAVSEVLAADQTQAAIDEMVGLLLSLGDTSEQLFRKNEASGYAGLDEDGLLLPQVLPSLGITDVFEVASEAAMLALDVQKGDVAVRIDENKSYILASSPASTLANWKLLRTPTDAVLSVAGLTGAISASSLRTALSLVIGTDVQAYSATLGLLAAVSTTTFGRNLLALADAAALLSAAGAASASHSHAAGDVTSGQLAIGRVASGTATDGYIPIVTSGSLALGPAPAGYTDEQARDAIGAALVAGSGITITPNDGGDTITVAATTAVPMVVEIVVTDPNGVALTVGDGKAYALVPAILNGRDITAVSAAVTSQSTSGLPTVQIARIRSGSPVDVLSTKLTIDANETASYTAATPAVINTSNDDLATGDLLRIDIDVAGTGAKGLIVTITTN